VLGFLKDSYRIFENTGQIFTPQPAFARLRGATRGPRQQQYRSFVEMVQNIGEDICLEVKVARTEADKNAISILAYNVKDKKRISGLTLTLSPEGEKPVISKMTSAEGNVELGEWDDGRYILGASRAKDKVADIYLYIDLEA